MFPIKYTKYAIKRLVARKRKAYTETICGLSEKTEGKEKAAGKTAVKK